MTRRIASSIIFGLSIVLLCLMSFVTTAQAQSEDSRLRYDTGVLTLNNPDQFMRVTIDWGDGHVAAVRFREMRYIEQGNIYKVAAEATTDPINLAAGEAAHIDISQGGFHAVRGVVYIGGSNRIAANARVTVQIISRSTGRVESVLVALLIP